MGTQWRQPQHNSIIIIITKSIWWKNLHLADNSNLDKEEKFAKVVLLINKLNEQCLANNLPEQLVSRDESMVPCFGSNGCKQHVRNKSVKFGYKFWATATTLDYAIQFYPYAGKHEKYDCNLWFGGSVVATLAEKQPSQVGSNYHNKMDYFFPSPKLLRIPKAEGIAAAWTVRINRVENAPLQPIKEMEKLERGASDVITDNACLMEGQQSGESSVYICQKNAPQESPSLYQSSKWLGWDWPASKYFPI